MLCSHFIYINYPYLHQIWKTSCYFLYFLDPVAFNGSGTSELFSTTWIAIHLLNNKLILLVICCLQIFIEMNRVNRQDVHLCECGKKQCTVKPHKRPRSQICLAERDVFGKGALAWGNMLTCVLRYVPLVQLTSTTTLKHILNTEYSLKDLNRLQ